MFSDKLAASLLQLCENRHLSYEVAAELCDISSRYFGNVVRKESSPTLTILEKICKAFHVTPNELLGYPYPADLRFREKLAVISAHFVRSSELIIIYSPYDPPTYACCGTRDGIASWRTMQRRLEALSALGIPTQFEAFEGLPHGFGLSTGTVAEGWIDNAVAFWEAQMKQAIDSVNTL